jgi:hypothetical protein
MLDMLKWRGSMAALGHPSCGLGMRLYSVSRNLMMEAGCIQEEWASVIMEEMVLRKNTMPRSKQSCK